MSVPVSFSEKISSKNDTYPVQISASDLDRNFAYCNLLAPDSDRQGNPQPWLLEEVTGQSGYRQRRLVFQPAPPTDGKTYVLGFTGGQFSWIATEEC